MVVKQIITDTGLTPLQVELGEVELAEEQLTDLQRQKLNAGLQEAGFELLDDRRSKLIEKIKHLIIDLVHHRDDQEKLKLSEYISSKLHYDYPYLSKLFSETEGITIEQFIINHKIEKVKEWLAYDEFSLSEIADKLHYSSVAHLSAQFKKVTGMTPSYFKQLQHKQRKPLDNIM